jgi:Protein of unknown function (DUF3500)
MNNQFLFGGADPLSSISLDRRSFMKTVGAGALLSSTGLGSSLIADDKVQKSRNENLVLELYNSFSEKQKKGVCFDWDYVHKEHGLLRLNVRNNWNITPHIVRSDFFNSRQQEMIEAIFLDLYQPEWKKNILKQLKDDSGGFGKENSIALFGNPNTNQFEFVFTGRHITVRTDGEPESKVAFGGPIFYGHAADGFEEKPDHPGNVYWYQAKKANALYKMLGGKQRSKALIAELPDEDAVHFRGQGSSYPGLPVSELSEDQYDHLKGVLECLVEPFRDSDQKEVRNCLAAQGGLKKCSIAFYKEDDIGDDAVWDNWRLEGPAFVWHFRGAPHVHVWVNVASSPSAKIITG